MRVPLVPDTEMLPTPACVSATCPANGTTMVEPDVDDTIAPETLLLALVKPVTVKAEPDAGWLVMIPVYVAVETP